ncbi:MAG: tetratricopeptide repeat protein [Verrucomicrobia bacterium]|nr:tetratricopeptide repeat protein [Verrucomicrobiota bacterium]
MNKKLILSVLVGMAYWSPVSAQIFPLSENTWRNPEFVARFLGSYGVNTGVNPAITAEDKLLFETLVPLMQSNVPMAIQQLRASITPMTSAAFEYTLGNLYFQGRNLNEAVSAYEAAIRKFPNFLRAYKNMGLILVQQGDYEKARTMLVKAIELGGADADLYGTLGYCYLNSSKYVAALDAYKMAMIFNPDSRDWKLGKIQCLMNLEQYKEAVGLLDDMIERYPNEEALLLMQANALISEQKTAEAAANLQIVRQMGKATAVSLTLLGDIFVNQNNVDLAIPYYLEALKTDGLDLVRAMRVGKSLVNRGAWTEAESYLVSLENEKGSQLAETDRLEILNLKATSALGQGKNDEAAVILEKVVERDPLNGKALLLIAEYNWKKNELEKAQIFFNRAQKVEDTRVDALVRNAQMFVTMKEYGKAAKLLNEAQLLKPQNHVGDYLAKVEAAHRATQY